MKLSRAEREAFLAAPHVAVISIERGDDAPLTVPIWYSYAPGGEIGLWMEDGTAKVRALRAAGRLSVCVQDTRRPYRYVSVSGTVTRIAAIDWTRELLPIVERYLDADTAAGYLAALGGPSGVADQLFVSMRPLRWRAEQL